MVNAIEDFYDPLFYEARVGIGGRPTEIYVEDELSLGAVLELGCGNGDILLPLARQGLRVCGVDSSRSMLEGFGRRLESEPPELRSRVTLVHCEMQEFQSTDLFQRVLIPNDGFSHLLDDETLLTACGVAFQHLVPGGQIILDTTPYDVHFLAGIAGSQKSVFIDHGYYELPSGEFVFVSGAASFETRSGVLTVHFRYEFVGADGVVRRAHYRKLRQHPRTAGEIRFALMTAGFKDVHVEERALRDGEQRVVTRGVKRGMSE
jgi:SAM-dependent methyltransferase